MLAVDGHVQTGRLQDFHGGGSHLLCVIDDWSEQAVLCALTFSSYFDRKREVQSIQMKLPREAGMEAVNE